MKKYIPLFEEFVALNETSTKRRIDAKYALEKSHDSLDSEKYVDKLVRHLNVASNEEYHPLYTSDKCTVEARCLESDDVDAVEVDYIIKDSNGKCWLTLVTHKLGRNKYVVLFDGIKPSECSDKLAIKAVVDDMNEILGKYDNLYHRKPSVIDYDTILNMTESFNID